MRHTEKPKYSLGQNVRYLLKHVWAWDPFFLLCMGIHILSTLLFALGLMFLPKAVLADLEQQVPVSTLLITILLLSGGMALANSLQAWRQFGRPLSRP